LAKVVTSDNPRDILKAAEIKALYSKLATLDPSERGAYGKAVNDLKVALEAAIFAREAALEDETIQPLDVHSPLGHQRWSS